MFVVSEHVSVSPVLKQHVTQHVSVSPVLVKQHISNVCSHSTRFSVTSACKTTYFQCQCSVSACKTTTREHVSVSPVLVKQHISNVCIQ